MLTFSPAPASLPEGRRIYAIGDVHGCAERLAALHAQIADDLASRPVARPLVIHMGDLVDRGPASKAVVEMLLAPWPHAAHGIEPPQRMALMGNHEDMMLGAIGTSAFEAAGHWLANGGGATLDSWNIDPASPPGTWWRALPPTHLGFLRGLTLMHREGGYTFVHAGIRPNVTMERQTREDLLWIREPFLSWRERLPSVIVHGHTPVEEPEVWPSRIGIDTGAVAGGKLTCAVLENSQIAFLFA